MANWDLIIYFLLIGILLFVGKILKKNVPFLNRIVLPTALLGGLIGYNDAPIILKNLFNGLYVTGDGKVSVGGLVGASNSVSIVDSGNIGVINGNDNIGGLVGYSNISITINNSFNEGLISGDNRIGGLIGWVQSSSIVDISNSHNIGNVSGTNRYIGGLIGFSNSSPSIIETYNVGTISGNESVGGLIGYIVYSDFSKISNSYNKGTVIGSSNSGGLIGYLQWSSLTISDSNNTGDVIGDNKNAGGLVGYSISSILTISKSYNAGSISSYSYAGGLVGSANTLYILFSLNFGDIYITASNTNVGGIVGMTPNSLDIQEVYYTENVLSNGVVIDGVSVGIKQTDLVTFTSAYFTDTLLWDNTIWDLTSIDISNGVYPTLIYDTEEE